MPLRLHFVLFRHAPRVDIQQPYIYLCLRNLISDKMYTNKENSTKLIRISPSVKKRLEIFQAGDTPNLCIDRMITFFEITGYNPRYASKNPTALVEKRIEDLVKIVKSQERDIFKPILEKMSNMNSGLQDAPDYVRLMNEIRDLKEKNRQLQQQVSENEKAVSDDNAGYADKLKRLAELVKYQLNPDRFVKVKFSDEVKIPINTLQLLIKKIDEEYVL